MSSEIRTLFTTNSLDSPLILKKTLELGSDYLQGGWQNLHSEDVKVTQITGGQSNLIYLAEASPSVTPSCFLIRIHCQPEQQVFTDTVIFSIMSERGMGPKFYGFFPGGRLEEFLPSRTLDVDNIKGTEIARQVGALFPKYHSIDVPIPKVAGAIRFLRENLKSYIELGGRVHTMCPNSVHYPDEHIPKEISVKELGDEIDLFEKWASVLQDTLVFSHNDLAPLNVLELNSTKELVFIDFEYASYNWRAFDLCMFLCENAFDYRVPPPGLRIDQNFIENHPNLHVLSSAYIEALGEGSDSQKIERLMLEIKFFIPLVNLFWAVWSLKQHLRGHDNGHNLEVAASDRLSLYFHFKPQSERIYQQFTV